MQPDRPESAVSPPTGAGAVVAAVAVTLLAAVATAAVSRPAGWAVLFVAGCVVGHILARGG